MYNYTVLGTNNEKLKATVWREVEPGFARYVIAARSGTMDTSTSQNPDYSKALESLIKEHKSKDFILEDILVVSETVKSWSPSNRRVYLKGYSFPINLKDVEDISLFRKAIGNVVIGIGQKPGARGGNSTKRLELRFTEKYPQNILDHLNNDLKKFHQRHYKNSGPPPTKSRRGSNQDLNRAGFVYVFKLKGLNQDAIKIGHTVNLSERFKTLNKELRRSVTKLEWIRHTYFQKESVRDAYDLEQDLHFYFAKFRYPGENEIYRLSIEKFDELITNFKF